MSCSLCILASKSDLLNGIDYHPEYYRQLVDLELASGFSFRPGLWLADLRPDLLSDDLRARAAARTQRVSTPPAAPIRPIQLRFESLFGNPNAAWGSNHDGDKV